MSTSITVAKSEKELQAVYRLRYEVYVERLGEDQMYADREKREIYEPYDDYGHILVAKDGNNVVGTVRTNPWNELPDELFDVEAHMPKYLSRTGVKLPKTLDRSKCSSSAKICTASFGQTKNSPTTDNVTLGQRLLVEKYKLMCSLGVEIETGTVAKQFQEYFLRYGYRILERDVPSTFNQNGNLSKFGYLLLYDVAHLNKMNSPYFEYIPDDEEKRSRVIEHLEFLRNV